MPALTPPRWKLYIDGQYISAGLPTSSNQSPSTQSQSPKQPFETSTPTSPQNVPPSGKLYVDGQDVSAGPPTISQRQTALSLLVESGDAKEVHISPNWLQVARPNQRNTNSHPHITVNPNTVTEGTFDAYHPSTREKIKQWLDENIDKIPGVSFFHLIHEQAQTAKKETMMELAEKRKTGEAMAVGVAYGILIDAFVDAPGTIYETAKSIWDAAPVNDIGPLGLHHEAKSEKITIGNPDEEIKNELIMARAAPRTYSAEQKLKQAQKLQPEIIKLNEQAKQLKEQAKWFKENIQKAENDPFFARLYNTEAIEYNKQVAEYNQKVITVEAQLKALGVDRANNQVREFNERLGEVQRNFAIGEIAGSLVASAVLAKAITPTIEAVAPEKVVRTETSFRDIFGDTTGTRTTVKETVYKGWLWKKPVETRYSTTLEVDGDIRYMKSFINGREGVVLRIGGKDTRRFVLNKLMSTEPLRAEPNPPPRAPVGPDEFEKVTGKPWPTGVVKKELETQTILHTTDGQEITIMKLENKNIIFGKTTFRKRQFRPEFSLSAKEKVLTPEDISLMQKITDAKAVRVGDKYLKVTRSGNIFSTFYDPPASTELIESRLKIVPDTGTFRVNPTNVQMDEGVLLSVQGAPTWISREKDTSVRNTLNFIKVNVKVVKSPKERTPNFIEKSEPNETPMEYQQELDVIAIKQDLMKRYKPKLTNIPPQVMPQEQEQMFHEQHTTTPEIIRPPEEVQVQIPKQKQVNVELDTVDFSRASMVRILSPSSPRVRMTPSSILLGFRKLHAKDSWIRKLAFFKNPFGDTSPFSFSPKKKKKTHKRHRKTRKGRRGDKRAKKR